MAAVPWDFHRWQCEGLKPVAVWGGCDLNAPGCEFNLRSFRAPAWYEYPAGVSECAIQKVFTGAGGVAADVYSRARYGVIPAPGAGVPLPPGAVPWSPALQEDSILHENLDEASGLPMVYFDGASSDYEQWRADYSAAIQAAENRGEYFPEGRIPSLVPDYSDLVLAGVLVLVGVAVMR